MEPISLLVAFIVGAALATLMVMLARTGAESRHKDELRALEEKTRKETAKRSAATIKGQVGERFAPFEGGFGYEPADARFLGSPVDYVVFDGMSNGEIRQVVFVEVKVGALPLSPFQRQVEAALKNYRVDWRVVELDDPTADHRGAR